MAQITPTPIRLQEALYELMWHQSYGRVTIDAICERAGVRKGSFYHAYPDKATLAIEAFEFVWPNLGSMMLSHQAKLLLHAWPIGWTGGFKKPFNVSRSMEKSTGARFSMWAPSFRPWNLPWLKRSWRSFAETAAT